MPPREPYVPVPTASPQQVRGEVATPSMHVQFPEVRISGAVGDALEKLGQQGYGTLSRATGHVAQAFDSLGKSLEHAGNQIWDRAVNLQEVENQTIASKALVEYEHYVDEKRMELDQKKGANATSGMLKIYNDDLEKKRQELRGKLPGAVQRRFDAPSISLAGKAGIHAATHIAAETRAAAVGAAGAEVDMAVKGMGDANNQQEFMDSYSRARAKIYDVIGPAQGWTRQQMDVAVADKAEKGLSAMIVKKSETDPQTAWKMLKENKDKFINPAVEERVRHSIQSNEINWAARGATDRATSDLWDDKAPGAPTKTEAERIKEAKEQALSVLSEDVKNNPTMMSALNETIEKRVEAAVYRQESATRNYRVHTFDALTAQIYGPDGEIRDTPEKIWASQPEAKAMYDLLPPTGTHSQKSVREAIDTAVRKGERIDPFISGQNREYIRGLADSDDINQREKLMDMNLWDKNLKDDQGRPLKLNHGDRQALIALRNKLRKNPEGDPRVARAWGWLTNHNGQEMEALGLTSAKKDDPSYIKARGALGDALEAYQDSHKGIPADYNAVIKEIAPEFLKHQAAPWYTFGFGGARPGYEKEVPEDWAEKFTKAYQASQGQEPSQSEIFNAYWYQMWKDFYQGKAAPKAPTTARGTPTASRPAEVPRSE